MSDKYDYSKHTSLFREKIEEALKRGVLEGFTIEEHNGIFGSTSRILITAEIKLDRPYKIAKQYKDEAH